jgi:flagellar biogenesis protein FliO
MGKVLLALAIIGILIYLTARIWKAKTPSNGN